MPGYLAIPSFALLGIAAVFALGFLVGIPWVLGNILVRKALGIKPLDLLGGCGEAM